MERNVICDDTNYFIEIIMDQPNGLTIKVDGVASQIAGDSYDAIGQDAGYIRFGCVSASKGVYYVDNVMVSNNTTRDFYSTGLYDDTTSPR